MDWCYYLATKILGLSEKEFYQSTPKKIFKLADIHSQINNPSDKKDEESIEEVFIDQILF